MDRTTTAWQKPERKRRRRMNIIIVAKPGARPINLNLRCWHGRSRALAAIGSCALGCMIIGFAAALIFANPRDTTLREVRSLYGEIAAQRKSVDGLETASHRDLDALALQLGSLQAQATRLN